jgi:hypothetical protein
MEIFFPMSTRTLAVVYQAPLTPTQYIYDVARATFEPFMSSHPLPTHASAAAQEPHTTISEAKRIANAANAQLSTGATSTGGKAKSSLNAGDEPAVLSEAKIRAKAGLTGRTVLLPSDDAAAYQHHVSGYEKDLRPVGQRECDLVQSIADASWRLQRIPVLESAIYAQGRIQAHRAVSARCARF